MWEAARIWLLPWSAVMLILGLVPLAMVVARGRRFLYSPVSYAAWIHVLPSLAVGTLALSAGFTAPFYDRIPVPERDLPFTLGLLAVGFMALYAGYWLPVGTSAGRFVAGRLPDAHWSTGRTVPAAVGLLGLGLALSAVAFDRGLLGYQTPAEPTRGSAALVMAAVTATRMAVLLLVHAVMVLRAARPRMHAAAAIVLVSWIGVEFLMSGRRGALFEVFMLAGGIWALLGPPLRTPRRLVWGAAGLVTVVFAGMVYGTTFRQTLGETTVSTTDYVGATNDAARTIASRGLAGNAIYAFENLVLRLEIVSSTTVIVGRAEELRPQEAAYGLANNITTSLVYAIVPRVIWPNKPSVSDPRALTELYFGYVNSNAVTPVADLYRNFGALGVPLGMLALGILLRVMFVALIEGRPPSLARAVVYLLLLIGVSFEGFFGAIIPTLIRTGAIASVLAFGVHLVARVRVPDQHADGGETLSGI